MPQDERLQTEWTALKEIVEDLIVTLHEQGKLLEKLCMLIEQQTDLRDHPGELSVVVSKLSGLRQRVRRLGE